ncbi:Medium-Chain Specific Acyl-Coa Dehydrogenase [Manis pentadactyla]|nr:Medium-Chain Specific Acyl-Coa Dehydrogenase [Manis pentadactyla]
MTFSSSFLVGTQKSGGNNVGHFPGVFFRGKLQRRAPDWAAMPREPLFCPPCVAEPLGEKELDPPGHALPEGRAGAPLHLPPEPEEGRRRAAAARWRRNLSK